MEFEYRADTDTVIEIPTDGFTYVFALELTYKLAKMTDSLKPLYQFRQLSEALGVTQLYLEYMSRAHFSLTPYDITTADLCMRARAIIDGIVGWRTEIKTRLWK